jgi:hypothetical protein
VSPGATFERVYSALKARIGDAGFPPGSRLEPALLSDELNASITPVRDALHRLVGERLVAAPPRDGFHVPLLTEAALRDLYAWNARLLLLATKPPRAAWPAGDGSQPVGTDAVDSTAELFSRIADLSGSPEHAAAIRALSDRLRPARRAESRTVPGAAGELKTLWDAFLAMETENLRAALRVYHRRREKLTPQILAALQRGL